MQYIVSLMDFRVEADSESDAQEKAETLIADGQVWIEIVEEDKEYKENIEASIQSLIDLSNSLFPPT